MLVLVVDVGGNVVDLNGLTAHFDGDWLAVVPEAVVAFARDNEARNLLEM